MWKKFIVISLINIAYSSKVFSQLLKVSSEQILIEQAPPFNRKFIESNRISEVYGSVSTKKINDIIRPTPLIKSYRFNDDGYLIRVMKTRYLGKKIDTLLYQFEFNGGLLTEQTEWLKGAYLTKKYYYENGRLTKMEYYRVSSINGRKTLLFSEKFKYLKYTQQEIIIQCFNENNQPYKTITEIFDKYGNILSREERLEVSGKKIVYTFKYNDFHLITEKIIENNQFGNKTEKFLYEYDEWRNLIKSQYFKNGKLFSSTEYLYDKETFFLSAEITKNPIDNSLEIVKYKTITR